MSILGERNVTLRRRTGATTRSEATGRAVFTGTSDTTIRGSFQPLNGEEVALLPEGERASDQRKLYTTTELRTVDQYGEGDADQIGVDGVFYRCMQVEREVAIIPHDKVRLLRLPETQS